MEFEKKYENGLRLVVKEMTGLMSVTMGIIVGAGSSNETDEEDGISHFIEHMQFKGTKKRNAFEVSDSFDRIGAQVNAYTGKDATVYYTKCTSDHTATAFEVLADLFLNATYPDEEMIREKGVICEEISMNEDTPEDLCLDLLATGLFGKRGYGRNILGPAKNVRAFTLDMVDNYKRKWYRPENIVISFAGGVDFKTAEALVESFFASMDKGVFQAEKKEIQFGRKSLVKTKPIEQTHLAIGYPALDRNHRLADAMQAMSGVLGGNMSSRLFQEVREKLGLAYSVYSYVSAYEECGTLNLYAGVNAENARSAYDAINAVVDNLKKNGITDAEFSRSREQMKSSMFFANESTSSQMILYGKYMLQNNKIFDFSEKMERINSMKKDDVLETIELVFKDDRKSVALVGNTQKPFEL
ncbi:MAG: insulinase family protein [Clostridiales bacterium]|nr:insulinase family protein [Clostridiales bacterium]